MVQYRNHCCRLPGSFSHLKNSTYFDKHTPTAQTLSSLSVSLLHSCLSQVFFIFCFFLDSHFSPSYKLLPIPCNSLSTSHFCWVIAAEVTAEVINLAWGSWSRRETGDEAEKRRRGGGGGTRRKMRRRSSSSTKVSRPQCGLPKHGDTMLHL